MKKSIFLFLFLVSINVSCIYSQTFQAKVFGDFNKNASMVVVSKTSETNITALIESYLLMEGFDVRSESVASSDKKEILNDVNDKNGVEQKISVSNTTYIASNYIVETNFSEDWDLIWKIKTITVKISDLSTGKIAAIINKKSTSMRNPDSVAKGIVEALMTEINK
jgi:hypothetical protein